MSKNTNLSRRNFRGLKKLQSSLDNLFNETWWPTTRWDEEIEEFQPFSRLSEDKDNYYLGVDLPGIKKEEVKINVEDNVLRIHGERKEEKEGRHQHYSEIFYGSFTCEFPLPSSVDNSKIKAHYENGVLNITIPKSAESKTKEVKIE